MLRIIEMYVHTDNTTAVPTYSSTIPMYYYNSFRAEHGPKDKIIIYDLQSI